MKKKLTNKYFWENYWDNKKNIESNFIINQQEIDINYCLSKIILQYRSFNNIKKYLKVLEIGGANGNFLKNIYFLGNCKVTSIDFSKKGNKLLKKNFEKDNIKPHKIITADFLKYSVKDKFDIVYSLGFIEHFNNPETIIKSHLKFLKKNGLLILGLPDLSSLNGILLKNLDRDFYNKHNIKIMNSEFFKNIQTQIDCKLISFAKISSYEPNMISYKKNEKNFFLTIFFFRTVAKFFHLLKKIYFFKIFNLELFNSYILVVLKKGLNKK
jgi:2-polyprenyl-3-methyl-5-hydroxy-6-metoxy-1,4-benzoquinol methylase